MVSSTYFQGRVDVVVERARRTQFHGIFARETIARYARDTLAHFEHAHVGFVPLLAWRFARERLRAVAQAGGTMTKERPRSPVRLRAQRRAARRWRRCSRLLGGGRVHVRSAGTDPADRDQSGSRRGNARGRARPVRRSSPSRSPTRSSRAADVVITMGCGDACPVYPGKQLPRLGTRRSGRQANGGGRRMRDDIRDRVEPASWRRSKYPAKTTG